VKIRDAGHVQNRAIYVAIGVQLDGNKEVLGLWAGQAEGVSIAAKNEAILAGEKEPWCGLRDGLLQG
jgi:hypothetical protein